MLISYFAEVRKDEIILAKKDETKPKTISKQIQFRRVRSKSEIKRSKKVAENESFCKNRKFGEN